MPRFFLHIDNNGDGYRDEDGADFASLEDAVLEAKAVARDLIIDAVRVGSDKVAERVVVAGSLDEELAAVPLDQVLPARFRH